MNDLNIIDSFLTSFISYIDSGFGLLKGDVGHLTSILIAIDVTLAALFWVLDSEAHILPRLIKKVLYIGAFAFILNNFATLAGLIFASFTRLGLDASANTLSAADLMKPGKLAGVGFEAAHPLLQQISQLLTLESFFPNFLTIIILLLAWLIVLMAFFVLAIQLFITVLEFKLTTLAGFVLVPFAFWNKTAFLAERVLGNVITSGIKVMVLAVIVGIGSSYFGQFTTALDGQDTDINQAMSLVLASLTLLGLGLFGPGIASGLVSGGPQLGAGAVVGTLGAAAGAGLLAGGAVAGVAGSLGGAGSAALSSIKSASAVRRQTGASSGGSGLGGSSPEDGGQNPPAPKGQSSGGTKPSRSSATQTSNASSRPISSAAGEGAVTEPDTAKSSNHSASDPPDWARKLQAEQHLRAHLQMTERALSSGDQGMGSANPDLSQSD